MFKLHKRINPRTNAVKVLPLLHINCFLISKCRLFKRSNCRFPVKNCPVGSIIPQSSSQSTPLNMSEETPCYVAMTSGAPLEVCRSKLVNSIYKMNKILLTCVSVPAIYHYSQSVWCTGCCHWCQVLRYLSLVSMCVDGSLIISQYYYYYYYYY